MAVKSFIASPEISNAIISKFDAACYAYTKKSREKILKEMCVSELANSSASLCLNHQFYPGTKFCYKEQR